MNKGVTSGNLDQTLKHRVTFINITSNFSEHNEASWWPCVEVMLPSLDFIWNGASQWKQTDGSVLSLYGGRNGSKRKANIQTVSNNSKSMFLWWSELRSVHFFQPDDHGFNSWSCRSVPMITNDARQWSLPRTPTTPNMLLVYENECKSRLCYIPQSPVQVDEQKT